MLNKLFGTPTKLKKRKAKASQKSWKRTQSEDVAKKNWPKLCAGDKVKKTSVVAKLK